MATEKTTTKTSANKPVKQTTSNEQAAEPISMRLPEHANDARAFNGQTLLTLRTLTEHNPASLATYEKLGGTPNLKKLSPKKPKPSILSTKLKYPTCAVAAVRAFPLV